MINVAIGPSLTAIQGYSLPSWIYWMSIVLSIPAAALFVWMLVAIVKRGPWAMTKVAPPVS
jgi:hypothetical protein